MDQLYKKMELASLSITLGDKGSMMLKNGIYDKCPAFAGKIEDRIGAGDTFLAVTSLCAAKNIPVPVSLFIGNLAAAEMVATIGTGMKLNKINLLKSIESLLK
jgi:bifunctional ADP-heptose synthase (sugar kinase/adenylyltransferase)